MTSDPPLSSFPSPLPPSAFCAPAILLSGGMDYAMYERFRQQLGAAPAEGLVVVELSTLGGDPEVARMMGADIRFHSDIDTRRRFVFLGKAAIYSAGSTFMGFFARENRYLTRGTRLMIHERRLCKTVSLEGPLTACLAPARALLAEIESSIAIQREGFDNLARGSRVTFEEVASRAATDWYLEAEEAFALRLIAGVI